MITIRHQDITAIETPNGNQAAGLAVPSRGAAELSVIRQRQRPGGFNPVHCHDREEAMVQLFGTVVISGGGEEVVLHPGDTLIVPAGTPHEIRNPGEAEAEWLIVSTAGVRFFRDGGEEVKPAWAK